MPYTVSGLHPLESTRWDRAFLSGRVLVCHASAKHDRKRCDAGVRVNAEQRLGPRRDLGVIEEHEGLDQLTDVRGADEAGDRAVLVTAGAKDNSASSAEHGFVE